MTDDIDCPEKDCGGKVTFMLRQKGGMGHPYSLDARCDRCDFQEDDIQQHEQGIFCLGCNTWRNETMVCVSCVTKKLGTDVKPVYKTTDLYPMTNRATQIQMDCKNDDCKFYKSSGDCINPAPAITLNPDKTYVCWSKKGRDDHETMIDACSIPQSPYDIPAVSKEWLKRCPVKDPGRIHGCGRPMTVVNVYWLLSYRATAKLQVVYYCYEHEVMLIGDMDTRDLCAVDEKDGR